MTLKTKAIFTTAAVAVAALLYLQPWTVEQGVAKNHDVALEGVSLSAVDTAMTEVQKELVHHSFCKFPRTPADGQLLAVISQGPGVPPWGDP